MRKKENRNEQGRVPFLERVSEWVTREAKMPEGGEMLEMRSRGEVMIHDCRKILLYTPEKIVLRRRTETLSVCGSGLYCLSYFGQTVIVRGKIEALMFAKDVEKGRKEEELG